MDKEYEYIPYFITYSIVRLKYFLDTENVELKFIKFINLITQ